MTKFLVLYVWTLVSSCAGNNGTQATITTDTVPATKESKPVIIEKMTDKEFIDTLQQLGYFDYTDKAKLKLVKDALKKHFTGDKKFITAFNRKAPYQSFDMRFYSCGDGEELFEEGGVISLIKNMQPFLNKIGIKINYSNDRYVNNFHSIDVNGKTYVLAQGSSLLWGETIVKFAEMMNAELEMHASKERLYLLSSEEEFMIFLTKEQYQIVSDYFDYDKRPLTIQQWVDKTTADMHKLMNK